jgi:hypothetical protein
MYLLHVAQDAFKTTNHPARLPNPACRKPPSKPTRQHRSPIQFNTMQDMSMSDHQTLRDSARAMAPM